jgi:mevalonate kinase
MQPGTSICASAPGSLMLLGEHAVLHGRRALVAAVNQRLTVKLTPRQDRQLEIRSALGAHTTSLDDPETHPKFQFILAAAAALPIVSSGLTIEVTSEFSDQIGFGSSAAVTVATVAALRHFDGLPTDPRTILEAARAIIRSVQGRGSGADVAASVYGGMVLYRADPLEVTPLPAVHPITAVYSGSKRPTPEVIRIVEERRARRPEHFETLYDLMDRCAADAAEAARQGDWAAVGERLDIGQGIMEDMDLSNPALDAIIRALREDPGIQGAKISGSGLGDCAIGLGHTSPGFPFPPIPVAPAPRGLLLH